MTESELIESIERCFGKIDFPRKGEIVEGHSLEAQDTEETFCGRTWQSIAFDVLLCNRAGMFFFTPSAYRYYLPAFMMASIRDFEASDMIPDSIVFSLTIRDEAGENLQNWVRARLKAFTAEEIGVIEQYLKYLSAAHYEEFSEPDRKKALESISSVRNS